MVLYKNKNNRKDDGMYKTIITLKNDVPSDVLGSLRTHCLGAFDNRAGKLSNISHDPYTFVFEAEEKDYGCLDLGTVKLGYVKGFLPYVQSWEWVDEDPDECCDVLEVIARHPR
jgi:hypothetical protein